MAKPVSFFKEIELTQQQSHNGVVFPAILTPNSYNNTDTNVPTNDQLSSLTEAIKAEKPWLESLLLTSGALLFRGFPVISPSDFNDIIEAFGFPAMSYDGGRASRSHVIGRVYTANESPPDQKIPFHNEMAYVPEFPSKLFFFCEVAPESGGETPIVLSHIIYERMKERHPEFVAQLEEHGLIYTKMMGEKDDPSSSVGRGWQSTFSTTDKRVAEERAAKMGMKLEWTGDAVNVVMAPIPAIRFDAARQHKIWFNSMLVAYDYMEDARRNNIDIEPVKFGNGRPLPADIMHDCFRILDEECVAIPWQKGDVLLLDNLAVLHSRSPIIKPPRRILASLCK